MRKIRFPLSTVFLAALVLTTLSGCSTESTNRVDGSGYSVALPDNWTKSEKGVAGYALDSLFYGERLGGFTVNVNVAKTDPGNHDLAWVVRKSRQQIKAMVRTTTTPPKDFTLDGVAAAKYRFSQILQGRRLRQEQVTVLHDGSAYSITFTVPSESFAGQQPQFDEILGSWQWK